jgi:thioredoxin-related protein
MPPGISPLLRILIGIIATALWLGACSGSGSLGYDAAADPFAQLELAKTQAQQQDKLILVVAGGDWCRWCHALNTFIHENADIDAGLSHTFVTVKVYVGEENANAEFFEQLPATTAVPHFWILAADGTVLESLSTQTLENTRKGYDAQKFLPFIGHWQRWRGTVR